jgi:hypothetical protein
MNHAYLPLDPYLHHHEVVFTSLESLYERSYLLFPALGIINNDDNVFPSVKTLKEHFKKSGTLTIDGKQGKFIVIKRVNIY